GLLLDPPPEDTVWGTLLSDGTIRWDDAVPAFDTAPHCALRAEATVSVGMLSTALFDIARASRTLRCRGIAWPPPRCHPEGAGDPLCPGMTTDAD
ncbi:MAG: hypothetical protein CL927_02500, partial [Deltaproteobacteria bacterium]|nr:hypothetical protein [Deltaproteobacteria bacterium]